MVTINRNASKVSIHAALDGEKLLPCPFCGSRDLELCNTSTACYWIECKCGAEVTGESYCYYGEDTEEDHLAAARSAVEKWNKRVWFGMMTLR